MIALVDYLTDEDLIKLRDDHSLLDATRKAAAEELVKRLTLKEETNDV
jgi:hypothetical protein